MADKEIYSVSYARFIHEGVPAFAVGYIVGIQYNIGLEQSMLISIETLKSKQFKAVFENGYEVIFPLMEDTEITYRPIQTKEEKDESGTSEDNEGGI